MKTLESRPTACKIKRWLGLGLSLILITTPGLSQSATPAPRVGSRREILVSIPDRKLAVLENGKIVRVFPVAVGARVSPSPTGNFRIVNRVSRPAYYHPGVVIPAGPDNPIGPRWLGLDLKGYGIHGTNEPRSIGKAASHGCIRLRNRDIEQFFALARVGDVVHISGERDAHVAEVFGGAVTAGAVAQVQPAIGTQSAGGQ